MQKRGEIGGRANSQGQRERVFVRFQPLRSSGAELVCANLLTLHIFLRARYVYTESSAGIPVPASPPHISGQRHRASTYYTRYTRCAFGIFNPCHPTHIHPPIDPSTAVPHMKLSALSGTREVLPTLPRPWESGPGLVGVASPSEASAPAGVNLALEFAHGYNSSGQARFVRSRLRTR